MASHSEFPASSASRLLACPGSFALSKTVDTGVRKSSVFSSQGTLAHSISEACIVTGVEPSSFLGQTRHADGFDHEVDEEFVEAVDVYVNFVRGLMAMGYLILLEKRVSPQAHWTDPKVAYPKIELFGTADCIAWHPGTNHLVIADLKFGKGVPVDVKDNSQLKYYAAGALHHSVIEEILEANGQKLSRPQPLPAAIKTVIIQPRAIHADGPIRDHDYSASEIVTWAQKDLLHGVQKALTDNATTFQPGKHCRFCPAAQAAVCTALDQFSMDTARKAFADNPLENIPAIDEPGATLPVGHLDEKLLADLLDRIEIISPWLDQVRRLAQDLVEQGKDVPGWKLVPKRALRRFADPDAEVMQKLAGQGLFPDEYSETALLSPAKIEKKIGKARYEQDVKPHVVKHSTGNTLAPDGDPRQRVIAKRTAQQAFNLSTGSNSSSDW